jgi:hypothetical protein
VVDNVRKIIMSFFAVGGSKVIEVVIKEKRKKGLFFLALDFIMMILSNYILKAGLDMKLFEIGDYNGKLGYIITGLLCLAFSSACFVFHIKKNFFSKPLLQIGREGIMDMTGANCVGFIAWDEIKEISATNYFGKNAIGITVYDLEKLMARMSSMQREVMEASLNPNNPPISISINTASMDFYEVLSILRENLEEYRSSQSASRQKVK